MFVNNLILWPFLRHEERNDFSQKERRQAGWFNAQFSWLFSAYSFYPKDITQYPLSCFLTTIHTKKYTCMHDTHFYICPVQFRAKGYLGGRNLELHQRVAKSK